LSPCLLVSLSPCLLVSLSPCLLVPRGRAISPIARHSRKRATPMQWWQWSRAEQTLERWVRALIGARPYRIAFAPGKGSYVNLATKEVVVDPAMSERWGGKSLLPWLWRSTSVRTLEALQWRISRTMARHEAGHVLFTQDYAVAGSLHAWLSNALEDERIE